MFLGNAAQNSTTTTRDCNNYRQLKLSFKSVQRHLYLVIITFIGKLRRHWMKMNVFSALCSCTLSNKVYVQRHIACTLGMCIFITGSDAICILMNSQRYDTLKIHMKQLALRWDTIQHSATRCNGINMIVFISLVQTDWTKQDAY